MASVLLAEDNENLGFLIKDNLESCGHQVSWFKNGSSAFDAFKESKFEICILDIMMPKMDGFELAKRIRMENEFLPILFLTAKSGEDDRLAGFEIGGDDYITKPFSIKELNCRIKVFLRRTPDEDSQQTEQKQFHFGQSFFDAVNLQYSCKGQPPRTLTQMEGELLKMLVERTNNLVKREKILTRIWGANDYFKGRSLDVFVTRLRKYLQQDPHLEIRNHHSVGFTLLDDSKSKDS